MNALITPTVEESNQLNFDNWLADFNVGFSQAHYRAGHSRGESDYQKHFDMVFSYLDDLDKLSSNRTYIYKTHMIIADIIAFSHLCRFDPIYYHLFKLNKKHLW